MQASRKSVIVRITYIEKGHHHHLNTHIIIQVTVNNPSQETSFSQSLGDAEGKVAMALLEGHAPSIASAVLAMEAVKEAIFTSFLESINRECSVLCQTSTVSHFRHIPVDQLKIFKWNTLIDELESKSPLLLKILTSIAVRNDHRNKKKVGPAHYPGIGTAAAVLLKERNCHMSGLQSLVSMLMYSCHCEKQVTIVP